MANKLKIFEKLGLIEKKEVETDVMETVAMQQEVGNSELNATSFGSIASDTTVEEVKAPILETESMINPASSDVSIQNEESPASNINGHLMGAASSSTAPAQGLASLSEGYPKDNQVIEDVEKKLDAMIESYERNKLLSIEDIYRKANLIMDVKSTVFMVDVYAKALPENLPLDVKRDSVLNIMKASDLRVDDLLSDAYKRIDALNNILENVVQTTEELKTKNTATIRDLEKRIDELKRNIVEREKFQETQNTMIEYEIQRIINIVDFVKPK